MESKHKNPMNIKRTLSILCMSLAFAATNAIEPHGPELMSEPDAASEVIRQIKNRYPFRAEETNAGSGMSSSDDATFRVCNTNSYGELRNLLGDNIYTIDSLVVNGPVGVIDLDAMWEASLKGQLGVINLENAAIENRSIPDTAFFHQSEQYTLGDPYIRCIRLRKIMLPDDIANIGEQAFSYAINLRDVNIPTSLKTIGEYAFADCIRLRTDPLVFPEGVETIPNMCFLNCESLKGEVVLPNSIRAIGTGAFFQSKITAINFPFGLEKIGERAFHATMLKEAILPESCTDLQAGGQFAVCYELKRIHLPNGIEEIPTSFAYACTSLEEINIPQSVKTIGMGALWQCRGIRHLELPQALERIEKDALWYFDSLEEIIFPATLAYLGMESCKYWASIKKIYSMSATPPACVMSTLNIGDTPFGNPESDFYMRTPQQTPVYVPTGTADLYRNAEGWNYFTTYIETDDFPCGNLMPTIKESSCNDIYDLFGRKIDNMQKGNLYIKNGKKFIFKE